MLEKMINTMFLMDSMEDDWIKTDLTILPKVALVPAGNPYWS